MRIAVGIASLIAAFLLAGALAPSANTVAANPPASLTEAVMASGSERERDDMPDRRAGATMKRSPLSLSAGVSVTAICSTARTCSPSRSGAQRRLPTSSRPPVPKTSARTTRAAREWARWPTQSSSRATTSTPTRMATSTTWQRPSTPTRTDQPGPLLSHVGSPQRSISERSPASGEP